MEKVHSCSCNSEFPFGFHPPHFPLAKLLPRETKLLQQENAQHGGKSYPLFQRPLYASPSTVAQEWSEEGWRKSELPHLMSTNQTLGLPRLEEETELGKNS